MTVREYNEWYKRLNNAWNFVLCIDHALQKSDDNAKMQVFETQSNVTQNG